jgi:hypothetical protein
MSLLVRTSTDAGALLVRDTDDPFALAVTESTSALALRVRESTDPLAMRVRGLFSPASLPGLAAWYDASDSSTVLTTVSPDVPASNGQTVRRWLDKSGNNRHLEQVNIVQQPTYSGGLLSLNGSSQFWDMLNIADIMGDKAQVYVFSVCQNPTGATGVLVAFSPPSNSFFPVVGPTASYASLRRRQADANIEPIGPGIGGARLNLNLHDAWLSFSSGNARLFTNGVGGTQLNFTGGAGNSEDVATTVARVGASGSGALHYAGTINEILIITSPLTLTEILATRRYLQRKWGTPALP